MYRSPGRSQKSVRPGGRAPWTTPIARYKLRASRRPDCGVATPLPRGVNPPSPIVTFLSLFMACPPSPPGQDPSQSPESRGLSSNSHCLNSTEAGGAKRPANGSGTRSGWQRGLSPVTARALAGDPQAQGRGRNMPGHAKQTERVSRSAAGLLCLPLPPGATPPPVAGRLYIFFSAITAITRLAMAQAKPP